MRNKANEDVRTYIRLTWPALWNWSWNQGNSFENIWGVLERQRNSSSIQQTYKYFTITVMIPAWWLSTWDFYNSRSFNVSLHRKHRKWTLEPNKLNSSIVWCVFWGSYWYSSVSNLRLYWLWDTYHCKPIGYIYIKRHIAKYWLTWL